MLTNTQPNTSNTFTKQDHHYMQLALELANKAAKLGEVPVGAVLVQYYDNDEGLQIDTLIGQGFNKPIETNDPTSHAEIIALRDACNNLNNYRLPPKTTLYVTLEPCTMCVGAMIHSRLHRLVFATTEPRAGMVVSQAQLLDENFYNHRIKVESGLCADKSKQLLKSFFKSRRVAKNK